LCIGDVILDYYSEGLIERISPEAPIPILKLLKSERMVLGGSGNVARNICEAGSKCHLISVVGVDEDSERIVKLCNQEKNLTFDLIQDDQRCTTKKQRFVSGNQQIIRVDREETTPIDEKIEDSIYKKIVKKILKCDVVVLSDYNKGILTKSLTAKIIRLSKKKKKILIVDPKKDDLGFYKNANIITPNQKELLGTESKEINQKEIDQVSQKLIKRYGFDAVVTTKSSEGISVVRKKKNFCIPSKAKEVFDVSGAGDTVVAFIASGLARGDDFENSVKLANEAAGIVVGKFGTAVVNRLEVENKKVNNKKILALDALISQLKQRESKKIGFTNGCFDLIHQGHIDYLRKAKEMCDFLIVGLNNDNSVRKLKGRKRPILNENERASILSCFEFVDGIVLFKEDTPIKLIKKLKPHFLFKGDDYTLNEVVGKNEIKEWNGEVVLIKCTKNKSTSRIIERIRNGT
jgi:D-beta-D-heptose 7-phosphate kinase/D-beta-D-heptose 1-phosphate adenosyltransferase